MFNKMTWVPPLNKYKIISNICIVDNCDGLHFNCTIEGDYPLCVDNFSDTTDIIGYVENITIQNHNMYADLVIKDRGWVEKDFTTYMYVVGVNKKGKINDVRIYPCVK